MKKQQPDLSRRSLLKALTIGGAATVALTATSASAQVTQSNVGTKGADGYHETAHIRSYYDSLRG